MKELMFCAPPQTLFATEQSNWSGRKPTIEFKLKY